MNVWIKMTRKRVKCFYCEKPIETGEYQVICTYFMKLKHSERTWTMAMHFHAQNPNCWLDRAIAELVSRPHIETRGRKPNALSDDKKEVRLKILRKRASIMQRISQEVETKMRPTRLARLSDQLEYLKGEIESYGGVPKKWTQ